MDVKRALKSQYHASLAMLRQCIEICPTDLWVAGDHTRSYWRIAYHTLFFADAYSCLRYEDFNRWEHDRDEAHSMWEEPWTPETRPAHAEPYSQAQLLDYWKIVDDAIDSRVDAMDLDAETSGFDWYKIPKLEHQLVNLRHIQGHVGQMSELLMAQGIDTDWVGSDKR